MIITELKPLTPSLSTYDEDEEESLDGDEVAPLPGKDDGSEDGANGDDGGFGLEGDMIETPGEEEF
ncbi:MAG: hypothetical protein ABSF47_02055 [Minisyncoccia bacterium]|jgi:hypothetical protein